MPITKLNLTTSKVSLELDLEELFGRKIKDASLRQQIAEDALNIVLRRTLQGYGVERGRAVKFKPYSKAYAKRKGQTKVDLEQKGRMLNSLRLISSSPGKVEIGIDDDNAPKAHGHMTGMDGLGPLPRRSFLGLTEDDLRKMKSSYKTDVQNLFKSTAKDYENTKTPEKFGFTQEDVKEALRLFSAKGSK